MIMFDFNAKSPFVSDLICYTLDDHSMQDKREGTPQEVTDLPRINYRVKRCLTT